MVHFVGRVDTQIKTRGYRVELGEIEVALDSVAVLRESAVVAVPSDGFEGTAICCAYVAADDSVGPPEIRAALERVVPNYMIPSKWLAYDAVAPQLERQGRSAPPPRDLCPADAVAIGPPELENPCRTRRN